MESLLPAHQERLWHATQPLITLSEGCEVFPAFMFFLSCLFVVVFKNSPDTVFQMQHYPKAPKLSHTRVLYPGLILVLGSIALLAIKLCVAVGSE